MLLPHQLEIISKASQLNRIGLFCDTGTGKTLIAKELLKVWGVKKLLVIVPKLILKQTEEIFGECNVVTYSQAVLERNLKKIKEAEFDCVIFDEAHYIKNALTQRHKKLQGVAKNAKRFIAITATPIANSYLDFYGIYSLISPESLPSTYYKFRNQYFYDSTQFAQFSIYKPYDESIEHFEKLMARNCFFVDKKKVLKDVEIVEQTIKVKMCDGIEDAYNQMKNTFVLELEDIDMTVQNALTKVVKLRQIVSGFVYDEDKRIVKIAEPYKMFEVRKLMKEYITIPKWIIFYEYNAELIFLQQLVTEYPTRKFLFLKNKESVGLNLQDYTATIFYTPTFSLLDMVQAKGRNIRIGSNKTVRHFHLITEGTIEEKIMQSVSDKGYRIESLKQIKDLLT